jgi:uncharacterized protein YdaU (DUF1376 family)
MSGPPWMKYSPRDFVGDTQHLTCEERGAYIALINHYWINGGLPEDDVRLCRIVGLDEMRWQCVRHAMTLLFRANWRHKRIDEELAKATEKSQKATNSANNRWKDKQKTKNANAVRLQQCDGNANKITDTDIRDSPSESKDSSGLVNGQPVDLLGLVKPKDENKGALKAFGEAWNELASSFRLPTIDEIKPGSTRERRALARLREIPDTQALMARIRGSPYLRGEVNGFRCTFDWIVNPSNFQKIMEGNYEDRKESVRQHGLTERRHHG